VHDIVSLRDLLIGLRARLISSPSNIETKSQRMVSIVFPRSSVASPVSLSSRFAKLRCGTW